MRKKLTIFLSLTAMICAIPWSSNAQELNDDIKSGRPTIGQTGKLFTILLTPKAKTLKVQLAGKTAAQLDPSQINVLGRVYPRAGSPRALSFTWTGSHYEIQGGIEPKERLQIKVEQKSTKATETFEIDENALTPK